MEDFNRQYAKEHFPRLTPQEQREALELLSPEQWRELLLSLPPEEHREMLQSLPPEELLGTLSAKQDPRVSRTVGRRPIGTAT